MQEKRRVLINCLDLDGTLIETDNLWVKFQEEMANQINNDVSLIKLWDSWLKNHLVKPGEDLESLISRYVIDSPNGKLAKAIKHALSLGDKFAVVTFNKSTNYVKFTLALMGLTKEEIDKVFIRCRDSDDCPDDKNGYIMEAVAHFGCLEIIEAAEEDESKLKDPSYPYISLLDDSPDNCDIAEGIGISSFFVQRANRTGHIRVYCDSIHGDDQDYLKVTLPTAAERFALGKSLVEIAQQVQATPVAMPSIVQQLVAQVNVLQAPSEGNENSKKRKLDKINDVNASTAPVSLLRTDETLDPVVETSTNVVKKTRKMNRINSEAKVLSF